MSKKNIVKAAMLLLLSIALLAACGPAAPPSTDGEETAVSTPDSNNPFLDDEENDNNNTDETAVVEPEMNVETAEEPTPPQPTTAAAPQPATDGPTPVDPRLDDAAVRIGDPDAPITIVEYTDYQCPFCQRHTLQTMPDITSQLIETGRVQYAIKDFPLDSIHDEARTAAAAARCAGEQDAYLLMHDAIFTEQASWSGQTPAVAATIMESLAADIGLETAVFNECLASGKYDDVVQQNLDEGVSFGVTGTPAFFIDGYPVTGAQPIDLFLYAVELAEKGELASAYTQQEPQQQQRPPTPSAPVDIPIGSSYAIGNPDAPVTIIEYTDFQCPFCVRHQQQTFPQIEANFIDTGDVYYVYKDFPLSSIHPQAQKAAEAARCAGDQGQYRQMHDQLFNTQDEWANKRDAEARFSTYAGELGLDTAVFDDCLSSGAHEIEVLSNVEEGFNLGVSGTPAFFINGNFLSGAQPYNVFEQAILSMMGE